MKTAKQLSITEVAIALRLRYGAARDLIYRGALGPIAQVDGHVSVAASHVQRFAARERKALARRVREGG